jgi:ATP synthase F1 delta subunit
MDTYIFNTIAMNLCHNTDDNGHKITQEIQKIHDICHQSCIYTFFSNKSISETNKKNIYKDLIQQTQPSKLLLILLESLYNRKSFDILPALLKSLIWYTSHNSSIMDVDVISYQKISEQESQKISRMLAKKFPRKNFHIEYLQNKTIGGGMIIKIHDYIYDMSHMESLHNMSQFLE